MAEAFLNNIYGDRYSAFSAGSDPTQIDPLVVLVMNEIGVDVGNYRAKSVSVFENQLFDAIFTLCDQARESCPYVSGGGIHKHKSFSDPSEFKGKPDVVISEYKRIRDEIKEWIEEEFL